MPEDAAEGHWKAAEELAAAPEANRKEVKLAHERLAQESAGAIVFPIVSLSFATNKASSAQSQELGGMPAMKPLKNNCRLEPGL